MRVAALFAVLAMTLTASPVAAATGVGERQHVLHPGSERGCIASGVQRLGLQVYRTRLGLGVDARVAVQVVVGSIGPQRVRRAVRDQEVVPQRRERSEQLWNGRPRERHSEVPGHNHPRSERDRRRLVRQPGRLQRRRLCSRSNGVVRRVTRASGGTTHNHIYEMDMRLDSPSPWALSHSTCSGEWMLEAVVTHEAGHAFGLASCRRD